MSGKCLALSLGMIIGLGCFLNSQGQTPEAGMIPGTGVLSGRVQAPKPFKAARVYARNVDKNILFMVYTAGGVYRAVDLFPGTYEVSVDKKGFTSPVKKIVVTAGEGSTLNFSLGVDTHNDDVLAVTYDRMYPPGRGRELFEKTCDVCHGPGFLPFHHWDESHWSSAIDLMSTPATPRILPGTLDSKDRRDLVEYLTTNFGPGSPKRILDVGMEMPLDEAALSTAMYMEYYVPALPDKGLQQVHDVHFDQEGNVWYSDPGGSHIGKLDPRTGTFQDYASSVPHANPHGLTVDADDYVWGGGRGLERLDPKTGKMDYYATDSTGQRVGGHTLVVDSKKNVWFTDITRNRLHKWDWETQRILTWEMPGTNVFPYGVVIDKNDNLWIAEWIRCKLVRFDSATEKFTEYAPLKQPCAVKRLRIDSQGMIWYAYSAFKEGRLGKLDPNTGQRVEFTFPMPFQRPYDLVPDKTGNFWIGDDTSLNDAGQGPPGTANFAMMKFDTALVRFNRATHKFTYYPSPQRTGMPKIEITGDGAVWFAARDTPKQAIDVFYPDVSKIKTMAAKY